VTNGTGDNGAVNSPMPTLPATLSEHRVWQWLRPGLLAGVRGLAAALLALVFNATLFSLTVVSLALVPVLGLGLFLFPVMVEVVRWRADVSRYLARLSGVEIPRPYRPMPPRAWFGSWRRFRHVISDPATWRDMAWLMASTAVAVVLGLVAFLMPLYGVEGVLGVPWVLHLSIDWYGYGVFWPMDNIFKALLSIPIGAAILFLGVFCAPWLTWVSARFDRLLLAPTAAARLSQRVQQLADSRADTVDAQATELRRIERDLHDGAQARLVSLSMSIGLAEELMKRDPDQAARVLAEAREASGQALTELRQLVRGIHPPVLAERGLAGAVRALAMAVPMRVLVDIDLVGRLESPVESAVYFAVAEALANVTKHSGARTAWIKVSHAGGVLAAEVGDDGRGGADPAGGTGLAGIRRRLAAFDGRIAVSSPPNGPTIVTMELPCALSSPKTTPSSGTG
jgi:signal transduction histidine kinase